MTRILLLALTGFIAYAQQNQNAANAEIHVLPVQGEVSMLLGDGGNIAVQVGDEGPMVVNSGAGTIAGRCRTRPTTRAKFAFCTGAGDTTFTGP